MIYYWQQLQEVYARFSNAMTALHRDQFSANILKINEATPFLLLLQIRITKKNLALKKLSKY